MPPPPARIHSLTFDEIAAELKTARRNILVFSWLYFDVERYLDHEVWLESLLRRDFCAGDSAARTRERRLLRIAFNEGWEGLARALTPRRQKTSGDAQALADQVRHAVAARALEYVQNLDDDGVPTGPEDFNRHLMVNSAVGRDQEAGEEGGLQAKVQAWFLEAGERGVFPMDLIKFALGLNDDGNPVAGGQRRRSLTLEATLSDRVNGKGSSASGTNDQSEIAETDIPVEQHEVKVA